MCGLTGFYDFNEGSDKQILSAMTDVLYHRGPDDSGYFFDASDNGQIGLGHRRLSILDLSRLGHQPMIFQDLVMVYNGEVYNFKEIRKELIAYGYDFDSNSDSEVILKAYHKWGIEAIHKFNGMFAIAIFDTSKQKLTLIRDRAGVKPLYWYQKDNLFLFSSELKSFHEHPRFHKSMSQEGVSLFLQHGYIPQPYTIFENTHKLQAGHILELDLHNGAVDTYQYWNVFDYYNQPKLDTSDEEAIEQTEALLKTACNYRMVSDVPVGVFLSGGYDSSAVTALLQSDMTSKLKTFSIGFYEDKFNEAHYAKAVADYLGTEHTEYYCTQQEALDIIPRLPEIWDEPFGDPSTIPTTLLSQITREQVTVSLSADGGDEVFGGYSKYERINTTMGKIKRLPYKKNIALLMEYFNPIFMGVSTSDKMNSRYNKLQALLTCDAENASQFLTAFTNVFSEKALGYILTDPSMMTVTEFDKIGKLGSHLSRLDKMLAIDYKTYQLDDILVKVDRATMSCSLEGREPLLDHNVIEYVARLDDKLKIREGSKKYLLKEITHKYLPKEMMDRPKMGFGVPIVDWFRNDLKAILLDYLSEERLTDAGIYQVANVIKMRDDYLLGKSNSIEKLWLLLTLEMWREQWMS